MEGNTQVAELSKELMIANEQHKFAQRQMQLTKNQLLKTKVTIEAVEKNKKYHVTVFCEPQMGKRGLYPTLSTKKSGEEVRLMMDLISLCDGKIFLLEVAESLNTPIWELYELIETLVSHKLLELNE